MEFERFLVNRLKNAVGRRMPASAAFFPTQKIVGVEPLGAQGGKADVSLRFANDQHLGVSIKQENATYFANRIGATTAYNTFQHPGTVERLGHLAIKLAQRKGQGRPFDSVACSFARKKVGQMSARIDPFCCPHDLTRLWTGVDPDARKNAQALLVSTIDDVPDHVDDLLDQLIRIDTRLVDLVPTYAVFRPNFDDASARGTPWIARNTYGVWRFALNE